MNAAVTVPFRVAGRLYSVQVSKFRGVVTARVDVPTAWGNVTVRADVDERVIREALTRLARSQITRQLRSLAIGEDELAVEGFFDDVGDFFTKTIPRAAKKVARSKVFRDISNGIASVTNSPAWNVAMAAVNVIPGYGQAISGAMAGAKMASAGLSLLARSKEGDPKARGAIKGLSKAAAAGNPRAQKAMATLTALNNAPQLQKGQAAPDFGAIFGGAMGGLSGIASGKPGKALGGFASAASSALKGSGAAGNVMSGVLGGLGDLASGKPEDALSGLAGALGGLFSGDDMPSFASTEQYQRLKEAYQRGANVGGVPVVAGDHALVLSQAKDGAYVLAGPTRYGVGGLRRRR